MAKNPKKSAVENGGTKELRSLAAQAGVKFIGKKTEDLRKELLAIAVDDDKKKTAKKKTVTAKKEPKEAATEGTKQASNHKTRVPVSKEDLDEMSEKYDTKKAKTIALREKGYSIHAIGEAVDLHPTNVSRYIREAGLSTSTVKVPKERIERIKATKAEKKAETEKSAEPAKQAAKPGKEEK